MSKSGSEGKTLTEAGHINGSLFVLSRVIQALNKKARGIQEHIPYRDSMMTMMLRDSIGGNCLTRMVATVHGNQRNINESISTCQFSESVSFISNSAKVNEETDPALIIKRLKKEVTNLKAEISLLKGSG